MPELNVLIVIFEFLAAGRTFAFDEAVGFGCFYVFLQRLTITFFRSVIYCLSIKFSCSKLKLGD
jgi:hypothetical protein